MGSNVVLGLVIGGAAVGVGFLVWRSRQAKQETKPPGTREACEAAAKAAGLPTAVCDIGVPIVEDIVDFVDNLGNAGGEFAAKDKKNRELNGEIETPLVQAVKSCMDSSYWYNVNTNGLATTLWGSALKYKNGCVPFAGAPGWEKCAPGTANMAWGVSSVNFGESPDRFTGRKNVEMIGPSNLVGTGVRYFSNGKIQTDPATGAFGPGNAGGKCAPLFPIPIPEGHRGFFVAGEPRTCPDGQVPDLKRGKRGGCMPIPTPSEGPAVDEHGEMGSGSFKDLIGTTNGPRSSTTINCGSDPNFVLDPGPPPYCRRKRAGEP